MATRGFFRGHPIIFINKKWLYSNTKKALPGYGGDKTPRPCLHCGKIFDFHESDPCLGDLPGVDNACCGHGVREESYIRFTNGVVVRGFTIEYTERWKKESTFDPIHNEQDIPPGVDPTKRMPNSQADKAICVASGEVLKYDINKELMDSLESMINTFEQVAGDIDEPKESRKEIRIFNKAVRTLKRAKRLRKNLK